MNWEPAPSDLRYPVVYCICPACLLVWPDLPSDEQMDAMIRRACEIPQQRLRSAR